MVKLIAVFLLSMNVWASSDKDQMNKARSLYEFGKLNEAIEIYSKIPASSDFWLEALEERAWAYARQGKHEPALADLQSITSPVWAPQVGPETYMLSTFVSLKICAYKDVIKKTTLFKKMMLPRVDTLQDLTEKPLSEETWQFLKKVEKEQITLSSLGQQAEKFPRYFYRDIQLLEATKKGLRQKAQDRLKQLARKDLAEIEANLKKMKIMDVELIQNVLTMDKGIKRTSKDLDFTKIDKNKTLLFPVTNEEVWVDEVGHFEVKAEKCPFNLGASL